MAGLWVLSEKMQIFLKILLVLIIISFFTHSSFATSLSTYSYIDTIGPVIEESDLYNSNCVPGLNGCSESYHEETKTNNGHLQETKSLTFENNIDSSKILTYDSNRTGGTLMATESLSYTGSVNQSSPTGTSCTFGLDEREHGIMTEKIRAENSLMGVTSISYSSHGAVHSQGDENNKLEFSTHIGPNTASGEDYAKGTVETGFSYFNDDGVTIAQGKDTSMVSGLISFVDRVISGGQGRIRSTDSSSASGITLIDTSYQQESIVNVDTDDQITGWKTYQGELMATGGELNQTRNLNFAGGIETDWIFAYKTNETQGGTITAKEVVAAGGTTQSANMTGESCIFANNDGDEDNTGYAEAAGSMDMMGVSRIGVQTSSQVSETIGSAQITYKTSLIYPVQYDPAINQTICDINSDGSFEDLNNNGRLDLHDVILLFTGYESIRKSVNNTMYDYNMNGRFDLADLVYLFEKI